MGIEFLDPRNAADVDGVATLYEEHLGDSPVVLLGPRFLREFYFSRLVKDELMDALVCRVDGKVVAFLSWTSRPEDFIGTGIRRHFVALSWIMLKSVVARPSSLKGIVSAVRIVTKRSGDQPSSHDNAGAIEALSLVVPPKFSKLVLPGGTSRLTVRLVQALGDHARKQGVTKVLYVVQPRNMASSIFFSGMGCEMVKRSYAGEQVYVYTHDLTEAAG